MFAGNRDGIRNQSQQDWQTDSAVCNFEGGTVRTDVKLSESQDNGRLKSQQRSVFEASNRLSQLLLWETAQQICAAPVTLVVRVVAAQHVGQSRVNSIGF
jgi:hypothetical protein